MMFAKNKPVRSKALRDSAKGQKCSIRIPGYCSFNEETTVLAHMNSGGGNKVDDSNAAFACSNCHDVVDFRVQTVHPRSEIIIWHYGGIAETQHIWIDAGLIKVEGHEI